MKYYLTLSLLFLGSLFVNAQSSSKIDSEEMQEKMNEAFSELQTILDTIDFSNLFNGELENLFGESQDGSFNFKSLDSLGQMNLNELFGGDISDFFSQAMPQDLDVNQLNDMMQESLKMMEQIDLSEFEKMFEGMDLNLEGLQDMFEGIEIEESEEGKDTKKRKTKKI